MQESDPCPQAEDAGPGTALTTRFGGRIVGLSRRVIPMNRVSRCAFLVALAVGSTVPLSADVKTMTRETLEVSTNVSDGDVVIPAGFTEKEQ
jgi:hypothetical protein